MFNPSWELYSQLQIRHQPSHVEWYPEKKSDHFALLTSRFFLYPESHALGP